MRQVARWMYGDSTIERWQEKLKRDDDDCIKPI